MNNIELPHNLDAVQFEAELLKREEILMNEQNQNQNQDQDQEKEKDQLKIRVTGFTNGDIFLSPASIKSETWLEHFQVLARKQLYSPGYILRAESWRDFKSQVEAAKGKIEFAHLNFSVQIFKWINAPDYIVEKDENFFNLMIHSKVNSSPVSSIPSARYKSKWMEDKLYARYEVSFSQAIDLLMYLNNEEIKAQRKTKWLGDSLQFAKDKLDEKLIRDKLVTEGKADHIGNPFAEKFPNADGSNLKLKPFQQVAIAFAEIANGGIINADQVGLGKTLDAIGYAVKNDFRTLLITKAALTANLEAEIIKLTGKNPLVLRGEVPTEFDLRSILLGNEQFTIINYTILGKEVPTGKLDQNTKEPEKKRYWVDVFSMSESLRKVGKGKGFDLIIADEAHLIRNMESGRSQAVRELSNYAPRRMALTATPVVNGVGDYFPLLSFIRPDIFNNYSQFLNTFTVDGRYPKNEKELQELLKSYLIRRTKKDVMKDLPPIQRFDQVYELSEAAMERYAKAERGVYEVLKTFDPSRQGSEFQINGVLAMLIRLKQIVAEDKIEFTGDLAREISDSAIDSDDPYPKVLIFSQFVPVVRSLAKYLGYDSNEALYITGEDHPKSSDKLAVVNKFQNNPKYNFLICSTDAASEGLTITQAGYCIFNDLMWTPAAHEQAEGRAYGRLNDPHKIDSYYILGKGTIDQMIYKILARKQYIIDTTVDGVERERVRGANMGAELIRMLKERMG